MTNSFEQDLDNLKSQILRKTRAANNDVAYNPINNFGDKFDHLNQDLISPIVETVNNKLGESGYNLEVIPSPNEVSNVRRSVQIVLTSKEKDINLLEDPYILIEGYPKSGSVRVTTSRSIDTGEIIPVEKVNKGMIQSSIFKMIESSF